MVGAERPRFLLGLLLAGLAGDWFGFWVVVLISLPLLGGFGWFLKQDKRNLKNVVSSLVERVAKKREMTRLEYVAAEDRFMPASTGVVTTDKP